MDSHPKKLKVGEWFELQGDGVDDIRHTLAPLVGLTRNTLQLLDNLVGIPIDLINPRLEAFRAKLKSGSAQIPEQERALPPPQITILTLRSLAPCMEQSELQEMLAALLVSASDSRIQDSVHPSFPAIIAQLTPADASHLQKLRSERNLYIDLNASDPRVLSSLHNLGRLGLIDMHVGARQHPGTPWQSRSSLTYFGEQFIATCVPVSSEPVQASGNQEV